MEIAHPTNFEFVIPPKTKELKMLIDNIYFPEVWNKDGLVFKINFTVRVEVIGNQTANYYSIRSTDLDSIRQELNSES